MASRCGTMGPLRDGGHGRGLLLAILVVASEVVVVAGSFSCASGASSCEDKGVQAASSGGQVRAKVWRALNVPDSDSLMGTGWSDPYLQLDVGTVSARTRVVDDSANPVYNESLSVGVHTSGYAITVSLMDSDSGLEFWDDTLGSTTVRVPFCSAYQSAASYTALECDDGEFDRSCDAFGTSWLMPSQLWCNETSWVNFNDDEATVCTCGDADCEDACVLLSLYILPFQVNVEETFAGEDVITTVAGVDTSLTEDSFEDYGKVYVGRAQLIDDTYSLFDAMAGGIMVRTDQAERQTTGGGEYVSFSMNMASTVWVCKWYTDLVDHGEPAWISNEGFKSTSSRMYLDDYTDTDEYFKCYSKVLAAVTRGYYGGLESDPVTLYANGVSGEEDQMYAVVVVPLLDDDASTVGYSRDLSLATFWIRFAEHVAMLVFFTLLSRRYFRLMKWRFDRVESQVLRLAGGFAAEEEEGEEAEEQGEAKEVRGRTKSVVGKLFACNGHSEQNLDFRRNLYFAALAVRMSLLLPLLVLWAWGMTCIATVNPPAIGFFILLVGTAGAFGLTGYRHWKARGWLMNSASLSLFGAALLLVVAFCAAVVFLDPAVYDGGLPLNFSGTTCIFFTLNMIPIILLLFITNRELSKNASRLGMIVSDVAAREKAMRKRLRQQQRKWGQTAGGAGGVGLGGTAEKRPNLVQRTLSQNLDVLGGDVDGSAVPVLLDKRKEEVMRSNAFYKLLGNCYTAAGDIRTFRFGDALASVYGAAGAARAAGAAGEGVGAKVSLGLKLYGTAFAVLFIYQMIAVARTRYPELALLNIVTLLVLDSVHYSLSRGSVQWSPAYNTVLMCAARVVLMASMARFWLLGYSLAFAIYGSALIRSSVNKHLPYLSDEEAGKIVFVGKGNSTTTTTTTSTTNNNNRGSNDSSNSSRYDSSHDLSSSPEVVLAYLTFYFVFILALLAYVEPASLPLPAVRITSQEWPVYVFAVLAMLLVLSVGLFSACVRAFRLDNMGLLKASLSAAHLWHPSIRLPSALALATVGMTVGCGLFLWASVGSTASCTAFIFLAALAFTGQYTFSQWQKSDYELVWWPPNADIDAARGVTWDRAPPQDGEEGRGGGAEDEEGGKGQQQQQQLGGGGGADMTGLFGFNDAVPGDDNFQRTMGGGGGGEGGDFEVPALNTTGASHFSAGGYGQASAMPALPLKGVLAKKTQGGLATVGQTGPPKHQQQQQQQQQQQDLRPTSPLGRGERDEAQALAEEKERKRRAKELRDTQRRCYVRSYEEDEEVSSALVRVGMGLVWLVDEGLATVLDKCKRKGRARRRGGGGGGRRHKYRREKVAPGVEDEASEGRDDEEEGGGGGSGSESETEEEEEEELELVGNLPLWRAFVLGYLLPFEYRNCLGAFVFFALLLSMGLLLSLEKPGWIGHIVWTSGLVLTCTALPLIKWFYTATLDWAMKASLIVAATTHALTCTLAFLLVLEAEAHQDHSLAVLNALLGFPILVCTIVLGLVFADGDPVGMGSNSSKRGGGSEQNVFSLSYLFSLARDDDGGGGGGGRNGRGQKNAVRRARRGRGGKDGRGKAQGVMERCLDFRFVMGSALFLWIFQAWVWGNRYIGTIVLLVSVLMGFALTVVRQVYSQDTGNLVSNSVRVKLDRFIRFAMFLALVLGSAGVAAEGFCLSVFFVLWMVKIGFRVAMRWMELEPETIFIFSPWIFPVYSYDAKTARLVDETPHALYLCKGLVVALVWGITVALFVEPLSVGVVVVALFLMAVTTLAAKCLSHGPSLLGTAALFVDQEAVLEAAKLTRADFLQRHMPFHVSCKEWQTEGSRSQLELAVMQMRRRECAADVALQLEAKLKTLMSTRVPEDHPTLKKGEGGADDEHHDTDDDDDEEEGGGSHDTDAEEGSHTHGDDHSDHSEMHSEGHSEHGHEQAKLRGDRLYCFKDALAEALIRGSGPFGVVGLGGLWYRLMWLLYRLGSVRGLGVLQRNWVLRKYDPDGQRRDVDLSLEPLDAKGMLLELVDADEELASTYLEETMCLTHFKVLIMLAAQTRLQRENSLFRKFLQQSQFKLRSNGMNIPEHIFSSQSFSSVSIPMVAVWMMGSLSAEQRVRLQQLKRRFVDLQNERDALADAADAQNEREAQELLEERKEMELQKQEQHFREEKRRRNARMEQWREALAGFDAAEFERVKAVWMARRHVVVAPEHRELRDKFERNVLLDGEEDTINAREMLEEIESKGKGCRPGQYGRKMQFYDPEFPPDENSLGEVTCKWQLSPQWKVSIAANPDILLYDEGTDPDDVRQGLLGDGWLLSALSMISAASVGDGRVDQQIAQLFVSFVGADGQTTNESYCGAYAVKIFQNGHWEVIIVDDFFPALRDTTAEDEVNKGLACGHSAGARELWVSLLEKALAKYYGSYQALERGYVHHALKTLTGAESEEVFLNVVSRGVGKLNLWKRMLKYRHNGFIMGAGTISSDLAEKQVQDSGLVFGAAYTILCVVEVDGKQLLKLRNPPGDHEEWRGDWGDKSALWTRRLRHKLNFHADEWDNVFWMSFDDFCLAFRSLYICRWLDPVRWLTSTLSGSWEMSSELDTAAGLPSADQVSCELSNNPQFLLKCNTPMHVRLTLRQLDEESLPATAFVLDTGGPIGTPGFRPARVEKLTRTNVVASTGQPARERLRHMYCSLKPGNYVIMAAAYLAGMEGSFQVELTTNAEPSAYRFRKLWPPPSGEDRELAFDDTTPLGRMANKVALQVDQRVDKLEANLNKAFDDGVAAGQEIAHELKDHVVEQVHEHNHSKGEGATSGAAPGGHKKEEGG